MQVNCFGIDWREVEKRADARAIVDELLSDDIDDYATGLPNDLWLSDSWMQHFEAAEELENLDLHPTSVVAEQVASIALIVSTGVARDELGICDLTEGCNFLSLSPQTVTGFAGQFERFGKSAQFDSLSDDTRAWLNQWQRALAYFSEKKLGVIGHAG